MALRVFRPRLNSFRGFLEGHFSWQMPQPVHLSMLTYRAFLRISTVKLPTKPETFSTSEYVWMVMFSWDAASTILGVRIQAEQSRVGNVLSSWDILPPMEGVFSTMSTL